jgi:hypothetical protein
MKKQKVTWDYELLAVLSLYAGTSVGELKRIVNKLAENLQKETSAKYLAPS